MDEYLDQPRPKKNPVNPYSPLSPAYLEEERSYNTDPGYLTQRYMESTSDIIKRNNNFIAPKNIRDAREVQKKPYELSDILKSNTLYYSLNNAIDEIQKSSDEAQYKVKNLELSRLMQSIQEEQRDATPEESAKIKELETELVDIQEDIEYNEKTLQKGKDYLGQFYADKLEIDKSNIDIFYDSWEEAADALGGSMSEIQAMAISMGAPATGAAIGAGLSAMSLGAAKGAFLGAWSGPGAVLSMGAGAIIGFGAGFGASIAAQRYSREQESYAEMAEAIDSRVEGEKNKYRLMNGGKEMPPELVQELEMQAIDEADAVFQANMDLYYVDIAEASLAFIPWGKF